MHLLYNIGIQLYGSILKIASFFNPKAKLWIEGRRDFFLKLPEIQSEKVHWFHCASLGEFDQALPVINLLKEQDSTLFILVTFFSPSGYLHYEKREHKADYVCYLPLDTSLNAKRFIAHFKPKKAFFVKYEFWANYIFEAKKNNCELYSISAIFREDHRFFKKNGSFFRSILLHFDHLFIQNKESGNLLNSIGITNYTITGDTRFDRVIENKKNVKKNEIIVDFLNENKAFIIGSSWPKDEEIILPIINNSHLGDKFIIAPHTIDQNHIEQIIKQITIPFVLYSELQNGKKYCNERVLILNTIGNLANAYSYGDFAYVGGGFSGNLHNILEPAVFGLPVIFGPKHSRFPEGEMFIKNGIGFSIKDETELKISIEKINSQKELLKEKTISFVESQKGASIKIIDYLNQSKF
jgi:3-deoxy-D-manno-octulosonic-acid transferase